MMIITVPRERNGQKLVRQEVSQVPVWAQIQNVKGKRLLEDLKTLDIPDLVPDPRREPQRKQNTVPLTSGSTVIVYHLHLLFTTIVKSPTKVNIQTNPITWGQDPDLKSEIIILIHCITKHISRGKINLKTVTTLKKRSEGWKHICDRDVCCKWLFNV